MEQDGAAGHVLQDGAAAPRSQHRPGHLQPVPHLLWEGFCIPGSLEGNGRGARRVSVSLGMCGISCGVGCTWGSSGAQGMLQGVTGSGEAGGACQEHRKHPRASHVGVLTLPGALHLSDPRIPHFWGQKNLAVVLSKGSSLPASPWCPRAWLGWAGTEAGEESQGVKVKHQRLALPKEVAGSEMKVGDESAQR